MPITTVPPTARKTPMRLTTTTKGERYESIPPLPALRLPTLDHDHSPKQRKATRIPALIPQIIKGSAPTSPIKPSASYPPTTASSRRSQRAELPKRGALLAIYSEAQVSPSSHSSGSVEVDAFGPVVVEKGEKSHMGMGRLGLNSQRYG